MRVIIAGSRSIREINHVEEAIRLSGWTPTEIISGGADGVDKLGEAYAKNNHIDVAIFPANWKLYGKSAGYKRNQKMAWYAQVLEKYIFNQPGSSEVIKDSYKGGLIAIWNEKSAGTRHMIEIARHNNLPVFVHIVEDL